MNTREHINALMDDGERRRKLRGKLRAARGAALANAEGFEVVVHAIEAVGKAVHPEGENLGRYTGQLMKLVERAR